ncbi:DEAD/DEAH box helicase [Methylobacterium sp. AMS5]|uniref:DEAD/DEAH box helicase n=1 Tax=Methylobacterium sp. AMS5 TaxID=925818 RepID=UPI00074F8661|nr:DEAD/DEAH box helicase [Methylobacterium sp. AMS5]AMB48287.1 helicase [Methylobacterium sp. AMS5]
MTDRVTMARGVVNAQLVGASKEVKAMAHEVLSYAVEGAEFSAAFGPGKWDGRSSFFANATCRFPAGFAHMLHAELTRRGVKVQIAANPLPKPKGSPDVLSDEERDGDPRYAYQPRTIRQLLKHGRGIAQIATGGGKSRIARLGARALRMPTLFITTRGVLMHQMKEGFEEDGWRVGVIGDGEWSPVRGINVAMVQTLMARLAEGSVEKELTAIIERRARAEEQEKLDLKKSMKASNAKPGDIHKMLDRLEKRQESERLSDEALAKEATAKADRQNKLRATTIKFLEMIEFVIGEEAHEAGGNSYFEILRHCKNAHYRLALTATPFMRDDAEDNMRLMAAFGPILIQVTEKELIDKGILATPYFKYVDTSPPKALFKTTPYQRAYKVGISENSIRNAVIVNEAMKGVRAGLPVMILVQHKAHGVNVQTALETAGAKVRFIQGEDNQKARKAALAGLKTGSIEVLIGTTILDVGVDVPAVGMVILAGAGKAEVALRQRIGRGLRAKKGVPNIAFILDFVDKQNTHLRDHARQRRGIVEATPGFAERILLPNQDFPWHLLVSAAQAA